MKKNIKYFTLLIITMMMIIFSGCISLMNSFIIRSYNNITSVIRGGSLSLSAAGRDIKWTVSSASDGSGSVARGTRINQSGFLVVDANESLSQLYVIAESEKEKKTTFILIRVVSVTGVNITAASHSVALGRTLQFRAQVTGINNPDNNVTWKVSSNSTGTGSVSPGTAISAGGLLSVSTRETLSTLYIFATSMIDTSQSASVFVSVVIPTVTQVIVSPANQSIRAGSNLQFSASVTGTNDPINTVTWRVSSNPSGTGAVTSGTRINGSGQLTVAPNESLSVLYITAASTFDPSKSGTVTVSIITPAVTRVLVGPAGQSVMTGGTLYFTASVEGTNNPSGSVTWRVSSNAAGSGSVSSNTRIDNNGMLTVAANESARTLYVFASSSFDPSKSGSVAVTVIPAPAISTPTPVPTTPAPTTQLPAPTTPAPTTPAPTTPTPTTPAPAPTTPAPAPSKPTTPTSPITPGRPTMTPTTPAPTIPTPTRPTTPAPTTPTTPAPTTPTTPTTPAPTTPTTPAPTTPTVTGVSISPASVSTRTNSNLSFTATVTGTNNPATGVTWKVGPNPDGTGSVATNTSISSSGQLRVAPNEWNPTLYVVAASTADPTKRAAAVVTVTNANPNQGSNQGKGN